jgi:hypothetical protein
MRDGRGHTCFAALRFRTPSFSGTTLFTISDKFELMSGGYGASDSGSGKDISSKESSR